MGCVFVSDDDESLGIGINVLDDVGTLDDRQKLLPVVFVIFLLGTKFPRCLNVVFGRNCARSGFALPLGVSWLPREPYRDILSTLI